MWEAWVANWVQLAYLCSLVVESPARVKQGLPESSCFDLSHPDLIVLLSWSHDQNLYSCTVVIKYNCTAWSYLITINQALQDSIARMNSQQSYIYLHRTCYPCSYHNTTISALVQDGFDTWLFYQPLWLSLFQAHFTPDMLNMREICKILSAPLCTFWFQCSCSSSCNDGVKILATNIYYLPLMLVKWLSTVLVRNNTWHVHIFCSVNQ